MINRLNQNTVHFEFILHSKGGPTMKQRQSNAPSQMLLPAVEFLPSNAQELVV